MKVPHLEPQVLIDAMNWRYATKKFDSNRVIAEPIIEALLESVRLTATSYGLQPIRAIVVTDGETKKKLKEASYQQAQIDTASHLVVFTCKSKMDAEYVGKYVDLIASVREVERPTLHAFEELMIDDKVSGSTAEESQIWAAKQAYIAMGTLLTAAALMGVDSCPMEGIERKEYDRILEIENSGYETVMLVALGYRSAEDPTRHRKKVRFSREEFFRFV